MPEKIAYATIFDDKVVVKVADSEMRTRLVKYLSEHSLDYQAHPTFLVVIGKPGKLYKLLVEMSWMYHALMIV